MDESEEIQDILSRTLIHHQQIDWNVVQQQLSLVINELINTDFHRLLTLLYQIDVSEIKVRNALHQHTENTSDILASLIIERQKEKIALRKKYSNWKQSDR